jgi:cell division protein FtsB
MRIFFKKISLFSLVVLGLVGFIFLSSFTQIQDLKDKAKLYDQTIEKLKQENLLLEKQIYYLKNEPAYQEKILRDKTGLVRKGEVPIKITPYSE